MKWVNHNRDHCKSCVLEFQILRDLWVNIILQVDVSDLVSVKDKCIIGLCGFHRNHLDVSVLNSTVVTMVIMVVTVVINYTTGTGISILDSKGYISNMLC